MQTRLAALAALSLTLAAPARAQIIDGLQLSILQDDVELGQIYVPPDQDPCRYVEYWFVYEDFEFVSPRSDASFSVKVIGEARERESWGWERQMWEAHPKGRLLVSTATESGPGCR